MRKFLWVVPAVMASVAVAVSAAYACTPQPRSFSISPKASEARASASVVGQGVSPGAPVQVRWDDLQGAVIGSTTADAQGQFTAPVTVPEAASGVHAVVFVAGDTNQPSLIEVGRMSFTVGPASTQLPAGAVDTWGSVTHGSTTAGGSGSGTYLAAGAGLMGVGVVALTGLATVATVRRRRVRVGSDTR
jgi:hypothetical protein